MKKLLSRINKNQKGFTLIELTVGLAISGLIGVGVMITIFQIFDINIDSRNHMTVINEVENVGKWILKDAQSAQIVTLGSSNGFPLTLEWQEYSGSHYLVTYSLASNQLKRSLSIDGGAVTDTLIARYIDPVTTICEETNGNLSLTISTIITDGTEEVTETRLWEISPRPN